MTIILQVLYDNWPSLLIILIALLIFLAWLTWKAHSQKISTGNEGLIGEEGVYKGNNIVQVHGELWKIKADPQLQAGDLVEVTGINKLTLTVTKRA
jgi:membrane protein implicated in regulation of membrane protease activity